MTTLTEDLGTRVSVISRKFQGMVAVRDHLLQEQERHRTALDAVELDLSRISEGRLIVLEVSARAQKRLSTSIERFVSAMLAAVFPDPYRLRVKFDETGGRPVCDLYYERGGEEVSIIGASGGGTVDMTSLALRFVLWSLADPRTRPVFLLDESFKWVSPRLRGRVVGALEWACQRLGIQVLLVSHSPGLVKGASRVFYLSRVGQVSLVDEVDADTAMERMKEAEERGEVG